MIRANITDSFRVFHLSDSQSQTDYILGKQVELCTGIEAYAVVGEPELFIRQGNLLASLDRGKPSNYTHAADVNQWNRIFISYVGAHFNYYETKYDTHITEPQNSSESRTALREGQAFVFFRDVPATQKLLIENRT